MNQKRPSTIEDAIKMLDDALVKQQMPDLTPLIENDFQAVKSVLGEETVSQAKEFKKAASELGASIASLSGAGMEQASVVAADAFTKVKKLAADVDREVRANPWPVIGGLALGGLALGLMLAKSRSAAAAAASEVTTDDVSEAASDSDAFIEPEMMGDIPPGVLPDGIEPEGSVV